MLLALFAKYWQPGLVKTRLARAVGSEAAAQFHRLCVETLVDRLAELQITRVLAYTPDEKQEAFTFAVKQGWELLPQGPGNLGLRLERFFQWAFDRGATRVAVIGADSPTLPLDYIVLALARLAQQPVVLGPSADGGYYLVAARPPVPPIFRQIAWGSAQVWQQTLERLQSAGLAAAILPGWYDVDEAQDLIRMADELAGHQPPHSQALAAFATRLAAPLRRPGSGA